MSPPRMASSLLSAAMITRAVHRGEKDAAWKGPNSGRRPNSTSYSVQPGEPVFAVGEDATP